MKRLKEIFSGSKTEGENQNQQNCCGGAEPHHHHDSSSNANTSYQCPMKCEGDKTYDAPGSCPVCNMHLASVANSV
jgi:Cu2+-exporting ATPase